MSDPSIPADWVRCRTRVAIEKLDQDLAAGVEVWAQRIRPGRYNLFNDQQQLLLCDCPGRRLERLT